jgi:hypothetical protein
MMLASLVMGALVGTPGRGERWPQAEILSRDDVAILALARGEAGEARLVLLGTAVGGIDPVRGQAAGAECLVLQALAQLLAVCSK